MRRVIWVLETKNHSRWGATLCVGTTKKSIDPQRNEVIMLDDTIINRRIDLVDGAIKYRLRRYEPIDEKPWWRFW